MIQDVITHVFGQGWPKGRSALKPASECWILARNGGGGALQIDAARVARGGEPIAAHRNTGKGYSGGFTETYQPGDSGAIVNTAGSWPPNFMLSHCEACEERGVRRVKVSGGAKPGTIARGATMGYGGDSGGTVGGGYKGADGLDAIDAFDCLAACDCGLSRLAPAGGAAPRCACGAGMWWACPVAEMDQGGVTKSGGRAGHVDSKLVGFGGRGAGFDVANPTEPSEGGASRFFPCFTYQAKAAGGERHAGCDDLYWRRDASNPFGFARITREEWAALPDEPVKTQAESLEGQRERVRAHGNVHPTVKSIALMERLVALVTPPGGRVGDVTLGSGGTAIALHRLNVSRGLGATLLGCDICPEAIAIAEARLAWWRSVRHDTKPVKHDAASQASDPRQTSIFDMLGGR